VVGRIRLRRPSPALVLSGIALFFAIGGSAFAVGQRLGAAQPRCANGAVKGFAVVTGDPKKGIDNIPGDFASAAVLFRARFNCTGQPVEVRRLPGSDGFAVRFRGVAVRAAVASVFANVPGAATVTTLPDGSIQVITAGNQTVPPGDSGGQFNKRTDLPFLVVAF
jgi:hypothetical protein